MLFQCFSGAFEVQNIGFILKSDASQTDIKTPIWNSLITSRVSATGNFIYFCGALDFIEDRTKPLIMIESI